MKPKKRRKLKFASETVDILEGYTYEDGRPRVRAIVRGLAASALDELDAVTLAARNAKVERPRGK